MSFLDMLPKKTTVILKAVFCFCWWTEEVSRVCTRQTAKAPQRCLQIQKKPNCPPSHGIHWTVDWYFNTCWSAFISFISTSYSTKHKDRPTLISLLLINKFQHQRNRLSLLVSSYYISILFSRSSTESKNCYNQVYFICIGHRLVINLYIYITGQFWFGKMSVNTQRSREC